MGINQKENIFKVIISSVKNRVRMSMSLRTAVSFFRYAMLGGLVFFLFFVVFYMFAAKKAYTDYASNVVAKMENRTVTFHEAEEELKAQNILLLIMDSDGTELFSNIPAEEDGSVPSNGFHLDSRDGSTNLIYVETMTIEADRTFAVKLSYTLTTEFRRMMSLMAYLAIAYLVIVIFATKRSRNDAEKMLGPIADMTASINSMTINTLNTERLKSYEMNTELRELAEVFNAMLDRLEESYESQKIFVSNASHELRTPIAVIRGYAEMLERWGSSDESVLNESIEAILHESKDMQELVDKLLFLSRHDKKTLKLEKDIFNVRPVVEELVKEMEMIAEDRVFETPRLDDISIMGDRQSIKQLVRIFMDNAVKYSHPGDKIMVSCENFHGNLTLAIEDTGIGMSKEDMGKIFERFFRSDEVRGRNISGHGLGLSIAKLIVASHGGNIHVNSTPGEGTTFIVTIPNGIPR
ncbi:MAG: HAMP domain-containing histidine kinase [Lachnospiraceae bacterium]|nr:HAMP domain-containing histidine kinase [Lachnospiraceae bacterium]